MQYIPIIKRATQTPVREYGDPNNIALKPAVRHVTHLWHEMGRDTNNMRKAGFVVLYRPLSVSQIRRTGRFVGGVSVKVEDLPARLQDQARELLKGETTTCIECGSTFDPTETTPDATPHSTNICPSSPASLDYDKFDLTQEWQHKT